MQYYYKDHLGSVRNVVSESSINGRDDYMPYGSRMQADGYATSSSRTKFSGKELQTLSVTASNGALTQLGLFDFGARMYDPVLCRWLTNDPLAEKYYSSSPYVYALNNPINAIDPDGRLVIFINGFHWNGDGGKSEYWGATDLFAQIRLNDFNALYRDGSVGGIGNIARNTNSGYRKAQGALQATKDLETILQAIGYQKDGDITSFRETIKVITHSMGAAYAKSYVRRLKLELQKLGLPDNIIEFEADFAPFQPTEQKAVEGVKTLQYSHNEDKTAGNKPMEGAKQMDTSSDKDQGHSINSFLSQMLTLPTGEYRVRNGQIVKTK